MMEAIEKLQERLQSEEAEEKHHSCMHQRLLSLLLEQAINGDGDSEGELSSLVSTLHEELASFLEPSSSPPPPIIRWLGEASDDELGIPPTSWQLQKINN